MALYVELHIENKCGGFLRQSYPAEQVEDFIKESFREERSLPDSMTGSEIVCYLEECSLGDLGYIFSFKIPNKQNIEETRCVLSYIDPSLIKDSMDTKTQKFMRDLTETFGISLRTKIQAESLLENMLDSGMDFNKSAGEIYDLVHSIAKDKK